MENTTLSRAERLDKIFGTPVFAVLLAIFCNVLWGCAFPFIKMGYRLFEIDPGNTASIFCFAGVRFMLGSLLVLLGSTLLQSRMPTFPKGKVFAECCVLGLWQTYEVNLLLFSNYLERNFYRNLLVQLDRKSVV